MHDDVMVIDCADAELILLLIQILEVLVAKQGRRIDPVDHRLPEMREGLEAFICRVSGRANATTGQAAGLASEYELSAAEAAEMLQVSAGAVRKRCERGTYLGDARKVFGRWKIRRSAIEAEMASRRAMT